MKVTLENQYIVKHADKVLVGVISQQSELNDYLYDILKVRSNDFTIFCGYNIREDLKASYIDYMQQIRQKTIQDIING